MAWKTMAWRTANSITVWHAQLKTSFPRAVPPNTPASSWGTIGDAAHDPTSDHAPKDFPGWGNDIVTAGDAPQAASLGLNMASVTEAMRLSRDPRIKYVIYNRRIFRRDFIWVPYTGLNPHTDHAHLSVVGDARADGTQPWSIGAAMAIIDDPNFTALIWRNLGMMLMQDTINNHVNNPAEVNELARTLKRIESKLGTLASGGVTQEMVRDAVQVALTDPATLAVLEPIIRKAVTGLALGEGN